MLTVETTDVDPEGNETIWFGGKVEEYPALNVTHKQYFFEFCPSDIVVFMFAKNGARFSLDY